MVCFVSAKEKRLLGRTKRELRGLPGKPRPPMKLGSPWEVQLGAASQPQTLSALCTFYLGLENFPLWLGAWAVAWLCDLEAAPDPLWVSTVSSIKGA